MNDKTQPPQGVMAPAEALAVLKRAEDTLWDDDRTLLSVDLKEAHATLSALLARCEGLEAALRETVETAETAIELAQRDGAIYDGTELDAARALLAATRTTGDGT